MLSLIMMILACGDQEKDTAEAVEETEVVEETEE